MTIALAIAGLILGAVIGEVAGALAGLALGIAIGNHRKLGERIESLEREVAALERRQLDKEDATRGDAAFDRLRRPPPTPAWTAPRAPEPTSTPEPPPRPTFAAAPPAASPAGGDPYDTGRVTHVSVEIESEPEAPPLRKAVRETPPDFADSIFRLVRDYFMNGNLVVRVGIIVLFFGVAFLLKFAADRNMLPIELRLAGVAAGGATLLLIGWRLRVRQRMYALALQGGGVGLLYLTVFAALRLYQLLPPTATFALLVAVAALSAFLAVGQNSLALAVLGATGGFLAPVLASTGQGNHVVLFSYYAFLNAGIVAIAWFKAWRPLNLLAFVFTFGIGTAWGVLRYSPQHFATTEPFLLLFFAMFLLVAVLFALRRAPRLTDYVDGTLVFGLPVVTMLLQSGLVRGRPYALAFSALGFGAVYLGLTFALWRRRGEELRLLAESFLALGVAFITLAVPLAVNGHWTAATWALEGAAILWVGLRQQRRLALAAGVLLQLGAGFAFLLRHDVTPGFQALIGSEFLGALFIALGGFVTARVLHQHRGRFAWIGATHAPVWWSLAWWFFAFGFEIREFVRYGHKWSAWLVLAALTAIGCAALTRWNGWREWRAPTLLLLPLMAVAAVYMIDDGHLLARSGAFAWPLAVVAWVGLLRWRSREPVSIDTPVHVATVWLFTGLLTFEVVWQLHQLRPGDPVWYLVLTGLLPTGVLGLLTWSADRGRWPESVYPLAYRRVAPAGLAVYVVLWVLFASVFDGDATPLPYLPIANPADIAQLLGLAALLAWTLRLKRDPPASREAADLLEFVPQVLAALAFIVLNVMLLRALHQYGGVRYDVGALAASTLVHASISIFWGALALGTMVYATRTGRRIVWFVGAALLGVVLVKMFLVDLSHVRSIARIVTFIAVGVLMLVIGRFSPLPPAPATQPAREAA